MKALLPDFLKPHAVLIENVSLAAVIFIVGWLASKWANGLALKGLRKAKVDEALARFLSSMTQYLVLAATVITALGRVGVETTSLVAILASAGLAVGLALQGSLANFSSGVMILFFRPFTLGDKVNAGGHTGVIDDIGIFASTMLTPDNEKIIIPNSAITGGSITNYTAQGTLRGHVSVGVAYGSDVGEILGLLEKAAGKPDTVLEEPAPAVAFVDMGASSINFNVMTWSKSADYLDMLHDVRRAVYEDLNEAEIDIPFDQIVVHQAAN